jgi:hypothetical protein
MPDPTRIADQYDGFRVCYRYQMVEQTVRTLDALPFRVASRPIATRDEAVATAEDWLRDVIGLWGIVEVAVRVGRAGEIVWSKTHRTSDFEKQQQMKPGN